jgi:restriction system protein
MPIPEFQSFFYPFLDFAKNGQEYSLQEVRNHLTDFFNLTEGEKAEKVPSGKQTKFDNRIYWTKSYFIKAKLLESTKRAHFKITDRGINFLNQFQNNITIKDLKEIDEFKEFSQGNGTNENTSVTQVEKNETISFEDKTPLEKLEESYQIIHNELAEQLLEKVKDNTWQFFEDLVVDLMVKMGYGGSRNRAGENLKRTNDEGIDGIINEDKLGLDLIYLQAKRWTKEGGIGRPEIQKFVGALHGQRAKKGVFITTSYFAKTAYDYVKMIDPKAILIDGTTLANLMIENNVGTSTVDSYQIKKIDLDYFER